MTGTRESCAAVPRPALDPRQGIGRLNLPMRGIAYVVAGVSVFSAQDAIIKALSDDYPVLEIVFVRSLVGLLLLVAFGLYKGGAKRLRMSMPKAHALRGLTMFGSYTAYYLAIAALPLAETVSLFYSAPLFMTALAWPMLRERPDLSRWLAVAVGFAGVLIILKPQGSLSPAALLALASAATYALSALLSRRIGAEDSAESMAVSATLVYILCSGVAGVLLGQGQFPAGDAPERAFLLRAWSWPRAEGFGLFCLCGLIAAIGFTCLAQAYRLAPAAAVAPFEYSSLPWAVFWGWLIWSEIPGTALWIGILLIVGGGVFVFRQEAMRARTEKRRNAGI